MEDAINAQPLSSKSKEKIANIESQVEREGEVLIFRAKKHFYSFITWLVCVILILLCFLETKILVMVFLMPVLLLLAIASFRDARFTSIRIAGSLIEVENYGSPIPRRYSFSPNSMNSIKVDESMEGKTKVIHNLVVMTGGQTYLLPDVDDKEKLLENLKKLKPGLKVKKM